MIRLENPEGAMKIYYDFGDFWIGRRCKQHFPLWRWRKLNLSCDAAEKNSSVYKLSKSCREQNWPDGKERKFFLSIISLSCARLFCRPFNFSGEGRKKNLLTSGNASRIFDPWKCQHRRLPNEPQICVACILHEITRDSVETGNEVRN